MIAKLPYGTDTCAVDLRGLKVRPILPSAPAGKRDAGDLVAEALDHPLDTPRLAELARKASSATVVVPDATRRAALPEVLPVVLERLTRGGIVPGAITVLVACGTHPPVADEELGAVIGELPLGVRSIQHDSRDAAALVTLGELRPGLPLRLSRHLLEADLVVTVGPVKHHYYAGFGGGPKMIFPGLAGYDEIQANHSRVLDLDTDPPRRHPGCEPGALDGNPVAEEIARAADLRPPDLCLCLVPGNDGRVAWAAAGSWRQAFRAAIDKVRAWYESSEGPFELMVASGGGHPSDATLIQAHKGLDAACRFLAPGGELLYVAAVDGGPGSEAMLPFLDDPRPETILGLLARRWVQYGHTTLRIVDKTERFAVHLHSALEPELARRLGFEPVSEPGDVIESWRERLPGATVGVMAGGAVYPVGGPIASLDRP